MQEGILDIELMNRPGAGSCDTQNNPNGRGFDHRTERLVVVDVVLLRVASNDPSRLVIGECAIRMELVLKDPFASHNIGALRSRMSCQVLLSTRALYSSAIATLKLVSARALW